MKWVFLKMICLQVMLLCFANTINSQEDNCHYLNVVLHIQNDPKIRALVEKEFEYIIKKQPYPVSYAVADSMTFVDIWYYLKDRQPDLLLALDSVVYKGRDQYRKLYWHDNIPLCTQLANPPANYNPLYIYLSKMAGNILAVEISSSIPDYSMREIYKTGRSLTIIFLMDKPGVVKKSLGFFVVDHN